MTGRPRRARQDELETIQKMDQLCFPHDSRDIEEGDLWWVVPAGRGSLAAYGGLRIVSDGRVGYLFRVGVLPEFRGRGLQRKLIRSRINHARKLGLERVVSYTTDRKSVV